MSKKRGNNEGSIIKRKDGRWMASVTVGRNADGSQKRQCFYGKTRSEVAEKMNELIHDINSGSYIDKDKNPTVSDWLPTWLNTYKKNNVKPRTYEQYEGIIRLYLIPNLGEVRLVDLNETMVQRLYNKLYERGLSARTVKLTNVVLKSALKKAVKLGLVLRNICENIDLPKETKKERRVLTPEEQKILLKTLKETDGGDIYIFALFTGMRRGEVLALTWEDVDFKHKVITINKNLSRIKTYVVDGNKTKLVVGDPKTTTSNRVIPIVECLIPLLKKQKEKTYSDESDLVFPSDTGGYIDPGNYNRKFYKIIKKTGLPKTNPHALRHCFASNALESGVDIKTTSEILGHSSIDITADLYTHASMSHKKNEIKKLNIFFE